ncbi:MAG: hypothetical protein LBS71_01065 [Puniceicoccales bacterium]|jgi:hypothetical protein|nr:hypothetical protein [Puniceicoccales bacterium]
MIKWLITIIFQIVSLDIYLHATVTPTPNVPKNDDIPQALLPALTPIETGNYWNLALLTILIIILFIAILALWFRYYRRRNPQKPLTSFQQLLRDLHRARLHADANDTKEFCSALCFALKAYMQREYQLPITCRTTEEFLKLVGNSAKFSWEIASDLNDILQYSDQAKFAGKMFQQNLHKDLFLKACRFVREVKRIRRPAKPTMNPTSK